MWSVVVGCWHSKITLLTTHRSVVVFMTPSKPKPPVYTSYDQAYFTLELFSRITPRWVEVSPTREPTFAEGFSEVLGIGIHSGLLSRYFYIVYNVRFTRKLKFAVYGQPESERKIEHFGLNSSPQTSNLFIRPCAPCEIYHASSMPMHSTFYSTKSPSWLHTMDQFTVVPRVRGH